MNMIQRPPTRTISSPPFHVTYVSDLSEEVVRGWLSDYETWFEQPQCGHGMRGRIARVSTAQAELFAKRHTMSLRRQVVCALLGRPARALRAFRLGLSLAAAGVPTVRTLGLIDRALPGQGSESCLILERLEAPDLFAYLTRHLVTKRGAERERAMAALVSSLGRSIAAMHNAGFRQRDLKAANILVSEEGDEFAVSLIDFEGMSRLRGSPSERIRLRDLARLGVSFRAPAVVAAGVTAADWEALIDAYLAELAVQPSASSSRREKMLRGAKIWGDRKVARNRRRRRPVT